MEHRYGRHGPRAWLRWRERRYGRPVSLPVPVGPQPTIVRVHVPINAERIIFIIMADNPDQENPIRGVVEIPANRQGVSFVSPLPSDTGEMKRIGVDDTPIARVKGYARRQASQDLIKIKRLYDLGQPVTIRRDLLAIRNEALAHNIIWSKIFLEDSSPGEQEMEDLIGAYQQAYEEKLDSLIKNYHLEKVDNPHVARIRQRAVRDKADFPNPPAMGFHQRDLGMIRVLHELEVSLESAIDRLPEIHKLADEYDKSYANPREEVDWPDNQEAFPDLNF